MHVHTCVLQAANAACAWTSGPCGKYPAGPVGGYIQYGTPFTVIVQKNLDHWNGNLTAPGNFEISYSFDGVTFYPGGSFTDDTSPSLSLYDWTVTTRSEYAPKGASECCLVTRPNRARDVCMTSDVLLLCACVCVLHGSVHDPAGCVLHQQPRRAARYVLGCLLSAPCACASASQTPACSMQGSLSPLSPLALWLVANCLGVYCVLCRCLCMP